MLHCLELRKEYSEVEISRGFVGLRTMHVLQELRGVCHVGLVTRAQKMPEGLVADSVFHLIQRTSHVYAAAARVQIHAHKLRDYTPTSPGAEGVT